MTPRLVRMIAAAALAGVLSASAPARAATETPANTGAMDIRLFRPAVDSKGLFAVNASDIMPHLDFSIGLTLDWGYSMFGMTGRADPADPASRREYDLVSHQIAGNLSFNLGLFNLLAVGFTVPVVILSGPEAPGIEGWEGWPADPTPAVTPSFSAEHIGDIEVHAKFRLLRVERNPVGLGAVLQFFTPTGGADRALGSDPGMGIGAAAIVDTMPADWFHAALNVGARFFTAPDDAIELVGADGTRFEYGHMMTFGLGASFTLVPERLNAVVEVYGNSMFAKFFDGLHTPMEAVAGLKIFVERNSYLYLGGGTGIFSSGYSAPDVRLVAAWIFEPSIGDRDRDGIKDDVDQCPDDPEDRDDFEDVDGCPDPDNDRDGILDVVDQCPLIPEDRDGDADEDGCPEGEQGDRDGDGILDVNDQCPDDPEDRDGFQDEEGCPDPDNDNDGIRDIDDLCPNDPEDHDRFNDVDGCPDIDNDQDRILDVDDECPNEPETYNGYQDEDGCPDQGRVVVTGTDVVIMDKIYFETDSAQILAVSYDILNQVAQTLNNNPHIRLIEVQGHADERNTDEYNVRLTRDRANAVVEYLVRQGVDVRRLLAAGYGERCPVDPRSSAAAWDKNRRVEFKIIWTDAGPTRVERSCPAGAELQPPLPTDLQR
ncbi:MAG: OmpA family protein [Myxococcota bacterium]|nr:OmpA family protein [Myxococcota bacterium]